MTKGTPADIFLKTKDKHTCDCFINYWCINHTSYFISRKRIGICTCLPSDILLQTTNHHLYVLFLSPPCPGLGHTCSVNLLESKSRGWHNKHQWLKEHKPMPILSLPDYRTRFTGSDKEDPYLSYFFPWYSQSFVSICYLIILTSAEK